MWLQTKRRGASAPTKSENATRFLDVRDEVHFLTGGLRLVRQAPGRQQRASE